MEIKDLEGKIINADCMDILKQLPDKCIDMILCDLPYCETGNNWDKTFDLVDVCNQYKRIIKDDAAIVLTGTFRFGVKLFNIMPELYKYDWVWEKDNGTNFIHANSQPIRIHEQIFVFGNGKATHSKTNTRIKYFPQMTEGKPYICVSGKKSKNWKGGNCIEGYKTINDGKRYPKTVQKFIRDKEKIHPTQKPVALFEYLIKTYTNEGDLVLDNCSGSGTTAIACHRLKRRFICIEKDPEYWAKSVERLKHEQAQMQLF